MTNPSFPQFIKIGYADNLKSRLKQLNRSECIPLAFRVYATLKVDRPLSDIKLHHLIDKLNNGLRTVENFQGKKRAREFYAITKEDATDVLRDIAYFMNQDDAVTIYNDELEDTKTFNNNENKSESYISSGRKGNFSFYKCGINRGESINLVDNPSVVAEVINDKKVKYKGKTYSISGLAKKILGLKAARGTYYFEYKGERLTNLRNRMEQNNCYQQKPENTKSDSFTNSFNSSKRAPFSFECCGIKPNTKLYFLNDTSIYCTVVDDRHVRFNDEITSLSPLAKNLLKKKNQPQGPLWFSLDGQKPLTILREELEQEGKYHK